MHIRIIELNIPPKRQLSTKGSYQCIYSLIATPVILNRTIPMPVIDPAAIIVIHSGNFANDLILVC